MKVKIPKNSTASDKLIGDLIFEACQHKTWAYCAMQRGDRAETASHLKKINNIVTALKTLGYTKNLFD